MTTFLARSTSRAKSAAATRWRSDATTRRISPWMNPLRYCFFNDIAKPRGICPRQFVRSRTHDFPWDVTRERRPARNLVAVDERNVHADDKLPRHFLAWNKVLVTISWTDWDRVCKTERERAAIFYESATNVRCFLFFFRTEQRRCIGHCALW